MATSETGGSSTPWVAFLVGIVLVALAVGGYFVLSGRGPERTAELEINAPNIESPDVNLPSPPDVTPEPAQ